MCRLRGEIERREIVGFEIVECFLEKRVIKFEIKVEIVKLKIVRNLEQIVDVNLEQSVGLEQRVDLKQRKHHKYGNRLKSIGIRW